MPPRYGVLLQTIELTIVSVFRLSSRVGFQPRGKFGRSSLRICRLQILLYCCAVGINNIGLSAGIHADVILSVG